MHMNFAGFGRRASGADIMPGRRQQGAATSRRSARWPAGSAAVLGAAVALSGAPAAQASAVTPVLCSQAALATAIGDAASGDTLSLTPFCTYTLTDSLPRIGASVIIQGNHATIRRSSASGTPPFSILTVVGAALSVTHVTLSNGDGEGGAILDADGPLTVTGSTFSDNSSGGEPLGGAIVHVGSGQLSVSGSRFFDNRAQSAGGAIVNLGGPATVVGSDFGGNTSSGLGGAIVSVGGTLIVTRSSFHDNTALGSISTALGSISDVGAIRVTGSDGTSNGLGGAIFSVGVLNVGFSTFTGNLASFEGILVTSSIKPDEVINGGDGGAIASFGSLAVTGSTYTGNRATSSVSPSDSRISRGPDVTSGDGNGGGIYSHGDLTITGSRISMSTASGHGGGVYNAGMAILRHSHVLLNSAENGGGGIFSQTGTVTLTATAVGLNHPDNCESLTVPIAGCLP